MEETTMTMILIGLVCVSISIGFIEKSVPFGFLVFGVGLIVFGILQYLMKDQNTI
jgi:hypothetical protein